MSNLFIHLYIPCLSFQFHADIYDFSNGEVLISPPYNFKSNASFEVVIIGDDNFELEEKIVVKLTRPRLRHDKHRINERILSERIYRDPSSTTIIIRGGSSLQYN